MQTLMRTLAPVAAMVLLAGCASVGSVSAELPTVTVRELRPVSFSPSAASFQARILVENRRPEPLALQELDYTVDLAGRPLYSATVTGLLPTRQGGTQTLLLPFQVSMDEIRSRGGDAPGASIQIRYHGRAYVADAPEQGPLLFEASLSVPLPAMPTALLLAATGAPPAEPFEVVLGIPNTNSFPFTIDSVDATVVVADARFPLRRIDKPTEVPAGGVGTMTLRLDPPQQDATDLAPGTVGPDAGQAQVTVEATVTLASPYGWIYVPVRITDVGSAGAQR